MDALYIVLIVVFILFMAFPLWHGRFWIVGVFPKIRVERAWFLFSGVGYPNAKEEGIIVPVFALSVLNYAFALISAVLATVLTLAVNMSVFDVMFIMLYMTVANVIINLGTAAVCAVIGKKKGPQA